MYSSSAFTGISKVSYAWFSSGLYSSIKFDRDFHDSSMQFLSVHDFPHNFIYKMLYSIPNVEKCCMKFEQRTTKSAFVAILEDLLEKRLLHAPRS